MDRDLELTLLRRLLDMRAAKATSQTEAGHRVPSTHYTDLKRFQQESSTLFRNTPLIAGLSCDLPRPGSYFTIDLASVPVLVMRDETGRARAFLNACRHRGSPVLNGRGYVRKAFACPYHAWTYDIQGALTSQPGAQDAFSEVDLSCTGLIQLEATEAAGMILVRLASQGGPIDADASLGGLAPELSSHAFGERAFFAEHTSEWTMNWKQPYETFLEAYHIFALHKESLAREVLSTPMLTDTFGPHGRGVLMGRDAANLLAREERDWTFERHANLVYWLFPNSVISMPMTGHVEHWQFHPIDERPDRTRVHVRFYTPGELKTEKEQAFWKRLVDFSINVVTTEDFAQQQNIFRSLRSGLLPELIFGRNEPALIHYHRSMDQSLSGGGP